MLCDTGLVSAGMDSTVIQWRLKDGSKEQVQMQIVQTIFTRVCSLIRTKLCPISRGCSATKDAFACMVSDDEDFSFGPLSPGSRGNPWQVFARTWLHSNSAQKWPRPRYLNSHGFMRMYLKSTKKFRFFASYCASCLCCCVCRSLTRNICHWASDEGCAFDMTKPLPWVYAIIRLF